MGKTKRIWLLEADPNYQERYQALFAEGYFTNFFSSFEDISRHRLSRSKKNPPTTPDLILSEFALKDGTLLDLIASLTAPVLVVSKNESKQDIITCLEAGAADYLVKPFRPSELQAKVEFHLSRASHSPRTQLVMNKNLDLSLEKLALFKDNKILSEQLTTKQIQIYTVLANANGKAVSKEEIIQRVWHGTKVAIKGFDVHLFHLRQKLAVAGLEIRYVSPGGYSLVAENRENATQSIGSQRKSKKL